MSKDMIILVVDDEKAHADGLAEALGNYCKEVTAVYNADDALKFICRSQPDIVVTDLKLGGDLDGLDVLDEAKKQRPDSEVILITAYATIETCKEALRRGAYDYLVKPIDINQQTELSCP